MKTFLGWMNKIHAYHGSPNRFDKFDGQKIGSGQNRAAFGHGTNFTDDIKAAKHYAGPKGWIYEVEIPYHKDDLLDWNSPVNEQKALAAFQIIIEEGNAPEILKSQIEEGATGEIAYRLLAINGDNIASALLLEHGISGISHIDPLSVSNGRNYVMFPGTESQVHILKRTKS
jgi:hypothetical protein